MSGERVPVDVAVGVLIDRAGRFLLTSRPEGKVYAGWWEFPGGKVEAGESFHDALVRELHEELGITITEATPWLTREFVYPHATVRIRFFRVTAWEGDIHPHEHDAIAWLRADLIASAEQLQAIGRFIGRHRPHGHFHFAAAGVDRLHGILDGCRQFDRALDG
mgnify:CR=1 FL=1